MYILGKLLLLLTFTYLNYYLHFTTDYTLYDCVCDE